MPVKSNPTVDATVRHAAKLMTTSVLSGRIWLMQYIEQLAGKGTLIQRKNP
jgi:hypothetical protein